MFLRALLCIEAAETRKAIAAALKRVDSLVTTASSFAELPVLLAQRPFDLAVIAVTGGGEITPAALEHLPRANAEIIVIGREVEAEQHVDWLAAGALAVLYENAAPESLQSAFARLAERRREQALASIPTVPDDDYGLGDYVSKSAAMQRFLADAARVAQLDSTLLVLGETGVGKGLLARSVHNDGKRRNRPFVAVNCGALTEALLESELFGHERGAFTGADRTRRGRFELAHTGTLFLDEIAELPLNLQVKLLRVLEERKVEPLGSERSIPTDVRIIAATNRNLAGEVAAGRFREDLYFRLNVISLTLPPLRERLDDIADVAQSYVEHFRVKFSCSVERFCDEALEVMRRYPWPGNLRELANVVERAAILAADDVIHVADLPVPIQEFAAPVIDLEAEPEPGAPGEWLARPWVEVRREVVEHAELRYLRAVLAAAGGKISEAARLAGMDPRSLYAKMKKYGLRKENFH